MEIGGKTVVGVEIGGKDVVRITIDGRTVWEKNTFSGFYIENVSGRSGVMRFSPLTGMNIEYSTDGTLWTLAVPDDDDELEIQVGKDEKLFLRGDNSALGSSSSGGCLHPLFDFNIGGNICSLLDKDGFEEMTKISTSNAFAYLFNVNSHLCSAESLNLGKVTSISGSYVFRSMFAYCTSMTYGPDLSGISSVTGSGVFYDMFKGAKKLESIIVPNLSSWGTGRFGSWVEGAGSEAENPVMVFGTQQLLDDCPSGNSGSGNYEKVLAQ